MRNSQIKNKSSNQRKPFAIKQPLLFSPRAHRNFTLGLFSFLCAYVVAGTFTPVQFSDASTVEITNNTTDYYIRLTSADSLPMSVEASPTGQLAYAADTLNIITNSPSGYKLYVSTSGNDNNIYQNGSSSTSSSGYFQPTTGTITSPTALTQNTWGFALSKETDTSSSKYNPLASAFANISEYVNYTGAPTASSTWASVPTFTNSENAKISELSTSNSPDGNDLDIYYGVNASTTLPDGSYSTEVTYTAISEGVNSFPTMQDFTSAQCDAMGTNTSINLSDSRDDKYYRVTKLADGHCWMTDNLALDGTDKAGNVRVLTPSDSNVTTNRTLAANIEIGTQAARDAVQIYSGVANDVTSECNSSYQYCVVNTTTKYGNLYNWYAATATTGTTSIVSSDAPESICPKGWRLPTLLKGDWNYASLMGAYGKPTSNVTDGNAITWSQGAPLYIALSGAYAAASYEQGGYAAYLWMSRGSRQNTADYLRFQANNGVFYPQADGDKSFGLSVRCIFSGQSDEIMQNFTAAQCTALAESTTSADNRKTMIDSRDGKFYKVSKLADGNCWMTSNLALDGMDGLGTVRKLTTSDSNVTTERTLATNIANNTASAYDVVQIYSGNADSTTTTCLSSYPYCVTSDIKYGNLYNWNAATAGVGKQTTTGTVTESVCPLGWQLPNNTGTKSFNTLMTAYSLPTTNVTNGSAVQTIQQSPLNFPPAGYYNNSSVTQARYAYYWSRIVYTSNTNLVYYLHFNSELGYFNPQGNNYKYRGFSVRCIYGS